MTATGTTSPEKGRRIVGAERQSLAKDLVRRYSEGESIRALASSTGRSYGFVHRVLTDPGCSSPAWRLPRKAMPSPPEGVNAPAVGLEREGPVATVTLRRPDVIDAQTPAMWEALREIARQLPGDVRMVVVRGQGRAFSAGLDTSIARESWAGELASLPPEQAAERIAGFQEAFAWLRRPDLITVAAVQGPAIGAGFQLALACDLRVLAADAQLAMAEVTLGLVPDLGGTKRLVELVGYARALEICLTGRRLAASEALQLGLANLVVPAAELDAAVDDLIAARARRRPGRRDRDQRLADRRRRTPVSRAGARRSGRRRCAACGNWPGWGSDRPAEQAGRTALRGEGQRQQRSVE